MCACGRALSPDDDVTVLRLYLGKDLTYEDCGNKFMHATLISCLLATEGLCMHSLI